LTFFVIVLAVALFLPEGFAAGFFRAAVFGG
jgi:hypothetical protein